jgi:hypothetical protein
MFVFPFQSFSAFLRPKHSFDQIRTRGTKNGQPSKSQRPNRSKCQCRIFYAITLVRYLMFHDMILMSIKDNSEGEAWNILRQSGYLFSKD